MFDRYAHLVDPYWVALPLSLRNAVSTYQPQWQCWDPDQRDMWVREQRDERMMTDPSTLQFFERGMEFEDFVPAFGEWYADGHHTCTMVGIRADESLNRFRAIMGDHSRYNGLRWTTWKGGHPRTQKKSAPAGRRGNRLAGADDQAGHPGGVGLAQGRRGTRWSCL